MEVTFNTPEEVFVCAIFLAVNCKKKVDLTLASGLTYTATGQPDDLAILETFFQNNQN
jgi:hypothetical protein